MSNACRQFNMDSSAHLIGGKMTRTITKKIPLASRKAKIDFFSPKNIPPSIFIRIRDSRRKVEGEGEEKRREEKRRDCNFEEG
ncbi:hypothetical protein AVEN_263786-1 [Araneus ventricosus]|uniref:Uncharacterized protein n=1 Tax=Araneus ventricosus TaxID=182803 RepID=A0A4Y2MYH8_ARAVE|nr:hypothetical protein AVEN_263786-1 [Araneus ventricosus]